MARLCDIVKEGVPCKVRYREDKPVQWLGYGLDDQDLYSHEELLISDDWKDLTPTVDEVMRDRGYIFHKFMACEWSAIIKKDNLGKGPDVPWLNCPTITSPAEATRICDFLDSLGGGK